MDCRDLEKLMQIYWDGDLPPDQTIRVRMHLGRCSNCQTEYGALDDWLSSPAPIAVPVGLRDRVLTAVVQAAERSAADRPQRPATIQIRPQRAEPHRRPGALRLIPIGWAGALAACIALLITSRPPPSSQNDTRFRFVDDHPPFAGFSVSGAVPTLLLAVMQPGQLSLAGAAAAQAAAFEHAAQTMAQVPLPLLMDRRPLRQDYVPLETNRGVQQMPAVINAISPLGA